MADSKELKVKPKQEVAAPAEQTMPGPVFTPDVDIFETEKNITLVADMPGVTPGKLNIDLRENVLSIIGDVETERNPEEELLIAEYETGRFFRQFNLSEVIDQDKIDAVLQDGVLRLTLPKVEKATPRRIAVKAG
jgi:HSP20 family molecular chaperone IbpA